MQLTTYEINEDILNEGARLEKQSSLALMSNAGLLEEFLRNSA